MDAQVALETLMKELERALKKVQKKGGQAFKQNEYDTAQKIAEQAKVISAKLRDLEDLQENLALILEGGSSQQTNSSSIKRKHLSPGLKTPEHAFRIPILKALMELGGTGATQEVVDIVGRIMDDLLNDYDREMLRSGRSQRWRNSAQWERATMVEEGLLKGDSPRGIWEISEKGRTYLKEST